jgi:hypothetical protein
MQTCQVAAALHAAVCGAACCPCTCCSGSGAARAGTCVVIQWVRTTGTPAWHFTWLLLLLLVLLPVGGWQTPTT